MSNEEYYYHVDIIYRRPHFKSYEEAVVSIFNFKVLHENFEVFREGFQGLYCMKILKYCVKILKYCVKTLKYCMKILKYCMKILKYCITFFNCCMNCLEKACTSKADTLRDCKWSCL